MCPRFERCQSDEKPGKGSRGGKTTGRNSDAAILAALRKEVAKEIASNDPPETKAAFGRLLAQGFPETEAWRLLIVLHAIAMLEILKPGRLFNKAQYVKWLDALPDLPIERPHEILRLERQKTGSTAGTRRSTGAKKPASRADAKELVFQFKVILRHIEPTIWRLIEVPASYSFWDLHVAIQDAMGWTDHHLHQFRIKDPGTGREMLIGIPADEEFPDMPSPLPGWEHAVADYFTKKGGKAAYEYDFGDGWEHEVVLERVVARDPNTRYPRCLAGARACPPEDCGGIGGYENLLQIMEDPSHEEYDSMVEWLGKPYDPEAFNPGKVRFWSPIKRWKMAFQDE